MGSLHEALRNLNLRWDETQSRWDDSVSRKFEEDHLAHLRKQYGLTLRAVEQLAHALATAERECS
jgi:hypothetical protein